MAKFTFKIEEYNEFRKIDTFEEWISADSRINALETIRKAYPENKGFLVELLNIE